MTSDNIQRLLSRATLGDAEAQNSLGMCYLNGEGVRQSDVEAIRWFSKAANLGLAVAQYNLATCYDEGYGVPQNSAEAAKWYHKAAEANRIYQNPSASNEELTEILEEDIPGRKEGSEEELDKAVSELTSLIGLHSVKTEVDNLISVAKVQKLRQEQGLPTANQSLHLVFTGNPGTGKTTVARIIAKIYKELGFLSKGHLVETDRSGLVGRYVGETALKTKTVIDEAIGGVLFIDEAYTLVKEGNDFGQEAIDTLLKDMEDHRSNLVVIVAGYTNEMKRFIASNPGMSSRFNHYILFEDYKPEEMVKIFELNCKKAQYELSGEAKEQLLTYFRSIDIATIGNGRGARNLFELATVQMARRITSGGVVQDQDLQTITSQDIIGAINTLQSI